MDQNIEITVPVLNEEETLKKQILKIRDYIDLNLKDLGVIKIVIADNGSSDSTQKIGQELQTTVPNVEYLRLEKRGVGLALKTSWTKSTAAIVGYMDLDLATDLKHLRPALEVLLSKNAQVANGSRLLKNSKVIGRSFTRGLTSRGLNLILKIVFQNKFSDGMCGFKFINREILEGLMKMGAESDGWFFATELLVTAETSGLKVVEIPVEWTDDPNSKVKIVKLAIEYLKAIKRLFFKLHKST